MKRRTEIMVEEEIRIIRQAGVSPGMACFACGDENGMVAPEQAALALGLSVRMIYRLVEEASIHFRESAAGTLVVCPRSILEQVRTA